jgi:hypothetical protein
MNLWGKEVLNSPVSFGVRRMKKFVCSWCVLRELLPSPSSSSFDSSFLYHFGSFLLPWFELWRELSLFTKGNQPIPHELVDWAISWSRSQELVFLCSSSISRDRLEIGCWCLEDIFSILPRTYLQSFKSFRVVLIEFWPVLPWFVLLFLDSAEPPRKTPNLRAAEPPGENVEPSGRGASAPACWNYVFELFECSFWDPSFALASQGSFSKYSCHQLAWVLWFENSLPLHRSWVSFFRPSV